MQYFVGLVKTESDILQLIAMNLMYLSSKNAMKVKKYYGVLEQNLIFIKCETNYIS